MLGSIQALQWETRSVSSTAVAYLTIADPDETSLTAGSDVGRLVSEDTHWHD